MKNLTLVLMLILGLMNPVVADDEKDSDGDTKLQKSILENPNDLAAFNRYMGSNLQQIAPMMNVDPDKAEAKLDGMLKFLEQVKPTEGRSQQLLLQAKRVVNSYKQRIALTRTSMKELIAKLEANPDDLQAVQMVAAKAINAAGPLARSEPDKAEVLLAEGKAVLEKAKEKTEDDNTKKLVDQQLSKFGRLESMIAAGKKLLALIGQDAAEMEIGQWANGDAISAADLKGKVVLLDFWAVWCGPCIATFPHLRQWQEKYADKGLVILGMTRFYNYTWDDTTKRATRSQGKVQPMDEIKMLEKFADKHQLTHRFAIQSDSDLSQFYGVTGIPHAVLIDQKGKIRLIRVGSGEQNAKDIDNLLKELLGA